MRLADETSPSIPDGVSWLRSHSGGATHCRQRGGPTWASRATALFPASCKKCVHWSIVPGRGLTETSVG